jgi:hypothetical protein
MQNNLQELVTVRNAPIARYVKKAASSGDIRFVATRLNQAGGNELGIGARATVFDHPTKKDAVIKLYSKDTAYDSFLENVKADKDNPHLPKILKRGKFDTSKAGKALHFVAMEKLQKLDPYHPIRDHIGYGIHGGVHEIKDKMEQGLYDGLRDHYPDFHKALSSLVNKHLKDENPPTIDLHLGNVMQRKDGTPVITDPMVDWNDDNEQNLSVGRYQRFTEPMNTDQLRQKIMPKVKLTSSDNRLLGQLGSRTSAFKEEVLHELKTARTAPITHFIRKAAEGFANHMTIASHLKSIGANKLGAGFRASVFDAPPKKGREDSVIKMYAADSAYDSFLGHAKADKDNPHHPRIFQRGKIPLGKTGKKQLNVIRMEKLQELEPDHPIRAHLKDGIMGSPASVLQSFDTGQYDSLKSAYPEFHKSLHNLARNLAGDTKQFATHFDLHLANIMQRKDGTPVITDPLVGYEATEDGKPKAVSAANAPGGTNTLKNALRPQTPPPNTSDIMKAKNIGAIGTATANRIIARKDAAKKLAEEAPVNNAGSGNIAGIGVGPKGEPGRNPSLMPMVRRSKNFAGKAVFSVPPKLYDEARLEKRKYQRWTKYLEENSFDELAPIREYANANPAMPIIIENEKTGAMCYVKYGSRKL